MPGVAGTGIPDDTPLTGYSVDLSAGVVYHVIQTYGELRRLLIRDYMLRCEEADAEEAAAEKNNTVA